MNSSSMENSNESKSRREDDRLLRGEGSYSDDFNLPSQLYAFMVRSPHAHARIKKVDVSSKKIEVDWGVDFLE